MTLTTEDWASVIRLLRGNGFLIVSEDRGKGTVTVQVPMLYATERP